MLDVSVSLEEFLEEIGMVCVQLGDGDGDVVMSSCIERQLEECITALCRVAVSGFDVNKNALFRAYNQFRRTDELPPFIEAVKVFFSGIPYYLNEKGEHHYHVILYTLLTAFGAEITAEEPSAKGRADIILKMPQGIYVIEIKYDDTADEALKQIDQRGYADKYRADGRPITKVGVAFSSKERNITEYKFVREK